MAFYVDTSAFVKLVVVEEHTEAMHAWARHANVQLVASDLLRTEALRAARRHSPEALLQTRTLLDAVTLLTISSDVCERAAELDPSIMRSLDALHLASALMLGDDLEAVVTYDERMTAACTVVGVPVLAPR